MRMTDQQNRTAISSEEAVDDRFIQNLGALIRKLAAGSCREPAKIHHCRQDKWLKPRHSAKGGGPTGNRLAPCQHQPQPNP